MFLALNGSSQASKYIIELSANINFGSWECFKLTIKTWRTLVAHAVQKQSKALLKFWISDKPLDTVYDHMGAIIVGFQKFSSTHLRPAHDT